MFVRRLKVALRRITPHSGTLRLPSRRPFVGVVCVCLAAIILTVYLGLSGFLSFSGKLPDNMLPYLLLPDLIDRDSVLLSAVQTLLLSGGDGEVSSFGLSQDDGSESAESSYVSDTPVGQDIGDVSITDEEQTPQDVPADQYPIVAKNMSGQSGELCKLLMINQTSYNEDINEYLKAKYPISAKLEDGSPIVLIVNTHTTESYVEQGVSFYSPPFTAPRFTEPDKNVTRTATALANSLNSLGVPTIQCTKVHDSPSYNSSYANSLKSIQQYMKDYPSIKYVIDVHRDSLIASDGTKFKPVINVNGQSCAQVMIVTGTDEGGAYHPNWKQNLTVAAAFQQAMNDKYPQLARPIYLRTSRFNQHTTPGAMILEVGSCGSTFEEAEYAAKLAGECFAKVILEHAAG